MNCLFLFIIAFFCMFFLGQGQSEAFSVQESLIVQAGGTTTISIIDPNPDASYTWTLDPLSFGNLEYEGTTATYTAPVGQGGAATLTATEHVSGEATGSATVSITVLITLSVTASADTIIAGEEITVSVTGTNSTSLTWTATHGTITGSGSQITYTAPDEAADAVISVTDEVGNTGSTSIKVITQLTGEWEIYTSRKDVNHFLMNGSTLWVSTKGGLINATSHVLYTKEDGLPANHITATAPDGQGGLWIACRWGGLVRMTGGSVFTVYDTENSDLPSNEITSLAYISGHGLYIGTIGGGLANLTFNGDEANWVIYRKENYSVPTNNISCLSYDSANGLLWVGTIGGGVARHYLSSRAWETFNQSIYTILPSNDVNAVAPDGSGGAWMGTNGHGLVHIPEDYHISVITKSGSALESNTILCLTRAGDGAVYAGTLSGGISLIKNGQLAMTYTSSNTPLTGNDVSAVYVNTSGTLNVGILGKGYGVFNLVLNTFQTSSTAVGENELPDNDVSAIARDMNQGKSQGLWIGTIGGGLVHADANGNWVELDKTDMDHISALLSDDQGGVWIGTEGAGLFHMTSDRSIDQHYDSTNKLPGNIIIDLEADGSDGLWIGTTVGLVYRSSAGQFVTYTTANSDLPSNYISSLTWNSVRGMWVGTFGGGVALFEDYNFKYIFNTSNSELPSNYVNATGLYGGLGLWIGILGGDGGLVLRSNSGAWSVFKTGSSPLPHNWITAIESDGGGGVWIATYGGGLLYVDSSGERATYDIINSESVHNDILTIEPDGEGGLWIGYDGGGLAHVSFGNKLLPDSGESPVVTQDEFSVDEQCRVILESNPDGYDQYIGVLFKEAVTFNKTFYFMPTTNYLLKYDGVNYVPWTGGDLVMDFKVDASTPKGEYVVYLLRVISGQDPATTKDWQLGAVRFTIK